MHVTRTTLIGGLTERFAFPNNATREYPQETTVRREGGAVHKRWRTTVSHCASLRLMLPNKFASLNDFEGLRSNSAPSGIAPYPEHDVRPAL